VSPAQAGNDETRPKGLTRQFSIQKGLGDESSLSKVHGEKLEVDKNSQKGGKKKTNGMSQQTTSQFLS
jgi:hypothetical protein